MRRKTLAITYLVLVIVMVTMALAMVVTDRLDLVPCILAPFSGALACMALYMTLTFKKGWDNE